MDILKFLSLIRLKTIEIIQTLFPCLTQVAGSSVHLLRSLCIFLFKEFENVDCDEYHADMSTLASTVSQGTPDVYVLPLTEVSLPTTKQPARSGESKFGSLSSRPPKLLQRASVLQGENFMCLCSFNFDG